jgi:hypothetical protein
MRLWDLARGAEVARHAGHSNGVKGGRSMAPELRITLV